MNIKKFEDEIEKLRRFSLDLKSAAEDEHILIAQLNSITTENREILFEKYKNGSGPIVGIRSAVSKILIERNIELEELENIISGHKIQHPQSFGKMYKSWFNMLYMFLIVDIRDEMNDAIQYISNSTIEGLDTDKIVAKKFDFTGERETGSTRCWIAFINDTHKSQTTAKQLFLNIENGEIEYCLYDKPRNQQSDKILLPKNQLFDYDKYINVFQKHLQEVFNDDWVYKPNYWRIGTKDGDTSFWEEMKSDGKVCIGWSEIGDLRNETIKNKKDIINLFDRVGFYKNDNKVKSRKAGEIYNFYDSIEIGDVVLAQDGQSILSIGIVQSDYEYNEDADFPHQKNVEWLLENPPFINTIGNQTTVYQINDVKKISEIENLIAEPLLPIMAEERKLNNKSHPLNQILYGPPGTGKTYSTIEKAIAIANPGFDLTQSRALVKEEYKRLCDVKQIEFITFHQSLSYEDFVEGIKPEIEEDKDGLRSVVYKIHDGIFKTIADRAGINSTDEKSEKVYDFDDAWNALLADVQESFDNKENYFLDILTPNKGLKVFEITNNGNLSMTPKSSSGREYTVSFNRLKELHKAFPKLSVVKNIDKEFRAVIGGMNSTTYWATLNFINNWLELNNQNKVVSKTNSIKPHVLIVDEINRGNVSQIFGELITLLEEDKREGEPEALQVILPYSKKAFSVPRNLYIIGTMNTADRSVEALDTALRRRFCFEEMLPKPELLSPEQMVCRLWERYWDVDWNNEDWLKEERDLSNLLKIPVLSDLNKAERKMLEEISEKGGGAEMFLNYTQNSEFRLDHLLNNINKRLEKLLSRDHTIGHSFFIGVTTEKQLYSTFYDKIIPLLQEYFFGDYGKIGLVLGKAFVEEVSKEKDFSFADFEYEEKDLLLEKRVYRINRFYKGGDDFLGAVKAIYIKGNPS